MDSDRFFRVPGKGLDLFFEETSLISCRLRFFMQLLPSFSFTFPRDSRKTILE